MPTININSIEDNAQVYVTGVVDYSHISHPIEGAELEADNARKVAKGMRTIDKPHTRLTIAHSSIDYANPAAPTLAEQYIAEKLYTSKAHPEKGDCLTAMNKSKNLPELYCRDSITSRTLENITIDGELAVGVSVTLILRIFATKQNKGVSLDAVIVNNKPVKWSSGGYSIAETLTERGFQIAPSSANVNDVRAQLDTNTAPTPVAQPVPAPAPAAAPYMQTQPAPAPVSVTPVTPVPAPVQAAPMPAQPVPAPAAPVQPAAPQNAAPSLPIPPKGYTYDANGRIVPVAQTGGIKL